MNTTNRPLGTLCALVTAGLLLAGCGGDADTDTAGSDTTEEASTESSTKTDSTEPAKDEPKAEKPEWHYDEVAKWGELDASFAACATGKAQSPIEIPEPAPSEKQPPTLAYKAGVAEVVNNGHTVQANAAPGMTMTLDGTAWDLVQVHFHSPAEHKFAGHTQEPVEVHFVHSQASGKLAVLGFVVHAGAENAAWKPFVDALGTPVDGKASANLDWPALVPSGLTTIRYQGSLTTPPCSEGVQWLMGQDPLELSQAQIDAFKTAYTGTNRPLQPLNDRAVTVDKA